MLSDYIEGDENLLEDNSFTDENKIKISLKINDEFFEKENEIDEDNESEREILYNKEEESSPLNSEEFLEQSPEENNSSYDEYYLERIDEVQEILEEICESIPSYAYEHLNGGIILTEEVKYHEESRNEDLLIMGEYQRSVLGNMIKIYYGSFMEMYRFSPREILKEKLEEVLLHEFTHHLEFLANEWGLVVEDNKFLEEYRKGKVNE
ncbi:MAG: metallopeptidase family protein [Peptoniphilus sp.]|uniref:metallopeptidase family protein n=1 Tax=Peptoniphilus sp. TaxID=1971214 RepID=UPI0025D8D53B|nr:metallopeptidase family protein [Peptoniphilus sp.]MCI5643850.1 metallopeptidase family protein [Peptoniphilus sp.]MDD7353069.1 metallopeptidase family protein [Peptoniphilaceae bacterium]